MLGGSSSPLFEIFETKKKIKMNPHPKTSLNP